MTKENFFTVKSTILIIVIAILFACFANVLMACIERLVYPEDYYELVTEYAEKYSIPPALVFAIIKVESNFDKDVVSRAGAMGLMQMMPSTYKWLTTKFDEPYIESLLFVPEVNIKYGTYYLNYLYQKFGTWEKTLIAYNWGEGNFSDFLCRKGGDF